MKLAALLLPVALFPLTACVDPMTSSASAPVAQAQAAELGTIVSVRPVQLQNGTPQGNQIGGAVLGGLAGALVGNQFGKGDGNAVATAAGAAGGALLGSQMAGNIQPIQSSQWNVRLDNGTMIAVIQNSNALYVGQRVRVVGSGSNIQLVP